MEVTVITENLQGCKLFSTQVNHEYHALLHGMCDSAGFLLYLMSRKSSFALPVSCSYQLVATGVTTDFYSEIITAEDYIAPSLTALN